MHGDHPMVATTRLEESSGTNGVKVRQATDLHKPSDRAFTKLQAGSCRQHEPRF
jgi:hypothetical protein